MAKDGEDKGLDEHTRIGVAPTPKLPGAPAPGPATPPAAPPPLDESTRLGVAPPPLPKAPAPVAPPAAPPSLDESTRLGVAPPPLPKTPAPPAAPPPGTTVHAAAPPPPLPAGDFAEHTILLPSLQQQAVPPARLQRMQPPGRSDIVTLDRAHYLMGRLPSCDFRLYSQTASREHAELSARDGRWYLTPIAGKSVLVNGSPVKEEVPLTHKMRLQLGGDELVFLDENEVTAIRSAPLPAGASLADNRWLALVIALVALALVVWLWATR